jgi:hypothetical protein
MPDASAGPWKVHDKGTFFLFSEGVDESVNDYYVILLTSSWTPAKTNAYYSDISAYELSTANGYTNGGQLLANVAVIEESDGTSYLDCDNPEWTASGGSITARYAAIYNGSSSTNELIVSGVLDNTPADVTATDGQVLRILIPVTGLIVADATGAWE